MNLLELKIKVFELLATNSQEFVLYILPIWGLTFVAGYYNWDLFFKKKNEGFNLLGICKRPKIPFYSGFYAKLKVNNSLSATEIACPGLACPKMVTSEIAIADQLSQILKSHSALNQANIDLIRIILAYQEYPSSIKKALNSAADLIAEQTTIKEKSILCLESILSAHKNLKALFASQKNVADNFKNYDCYQDSLKDLANKLNPYATNILKSLSFNKAFELAQLPATVIASTYLATEAGKCLVFKKDDDIFHKISQLPHLQARAILQSLESYIKDYNADTRLIIRQALISALREGNETLLLPENMPVSSQALRDTLEILYADLEDQQEVSKTIELENLLLDLHQNWIENYKKLLFEKENKGFKLGIIYKSFILIPLAEIVNLAFGNIEVDKLNRIKNLLNLNNLFDSTKISELKLPSDLDNDLKQKWLILRKVLQRNNCLSGRIGENIVPINSLIYSLVLLANESNKEMNVFGLENLVPLRRNKIETIIKKDLLEGTLPYKLAEHNIRIYLNKNSYQQALELEQDLIKNKQSPTVLSTIKYRRAL